MRHYCETEETKQLEFARKAAINFEENPENVTFTEGLEKGGLMALRWGMGNDCVVVIKLDEYFEPVNYVQFINKSKAKLTVVYHKAGIEAIKNFKE